MPVAENIPPSRRVTTPSPSEVQVPVSVDALHSPEQEEVSDFQYRYSVRVCVVLLHSFQLWNVTAFRQHVDFKTTHFI